MDMNQPSPDVTAFKLEIPRPGNSLIMRRPDVLAAGFESLGIDCEFGNVQKFCGVDRESLFRSASLPYGSLLSLLENRLSRLSNLKLWRVFPHAVSREWWMGFREGGIYYHSSKNFDDSSAEEVGNFEFPRIEAMVARFKEDLQNAERTYVRCEPGKTREEIVAVFKALRQHGRHTLVWVDETSDPSRLGKVEVLQEGLLLGFFEKLSKNAAPQPAAFAVWLNILARAFQILKPGRVNELTRQILRAPLPPMVAKPPVRLREDIAINGYNVDGPDGAPAPGITRHTLRVTTDWHNASIFSVPTVGLVPSTLYIASTWIWVPPGFDGYISVLFPGSPSIRSWTPEPELFGQWQRIATSFRLPENLKFQYTSLQIRGPAGTKVFTTGWRFEVGVCPGDAFVAAGQSAAA